MAYMDKLNETDEVYPHMHEFLDILNPFMRYKVIEFVFYDLISNFYIFEESDSHEIMYVAMLMQ